MKIDTVNVIEYTDDTINGITSYDETPEGNVEAETHFRSVLEEHGDNLNEEEIQACLEDGYWEQGDYQTFLVHSN